MSKRSIILMVILFASAGIFISGCIQPDTGTYNKERPGGNTSDIIVSKFESTQDLKKFSSEREIRDFIKAGAASSGYSQYGWGGFYDGFMRSGAMETAVPANAVAPMPPGAPSVNKAGADTGSAIVASDYSTTNIQVEGVDEG